MITCHFVSHVETRIFAIRRSSSAAFVLPAISRSPLKVSQVARVKWFKIYIVFFCHFYLQKSALYRGSYKFPSTFYTYKILYTSVLRLHIYCLRIYSTFPHHTIIVLVRTSKRILKKRNIHLYCFLYKIKRINHYMALRAIKVFQVLDCIVKRIAPRIYVRGFFVSAFFSFTLFFTFYTWSRFYRVDETKATNRERKWYDGESQMNSCTVKSRNCNASRYDLSLIFFSFFTRV